MAAVIQFSPPVKFRSLKDIGELQEELSDAVVWFLECLYRREDCDWNARVSAVLEGWREGQGNFARETGWHIEAICSAVERAMGSQHDE